MTTLICVITGLAVIFILIMIIDCNRFVIKEYTCRTEKLQKDEVFILLSDLHNKSYGRDNSRLLEAIEHIHPDWILIAGDMYTSVEGGSTQTAGKLVRALSERYPVYYANGNHEYKTRILPEEYGNIYETYQESLEDTNVTMLINSKVRLPVVNMDIYGLEIDREYYAKFKKKHMAPAYLEELLGQPDPSVYSVLIAHNPDYFEAYARWGADLVVSGHIHGGLMRLPWLGGVISPALRLFPKYDGGRFAKGITTMILSRGLGTHTLPVRIFNPGELVVIRCGKVDG